VNPKLRCALSVGLCACWLAGSAAVSSAGFYASATLHWTAPGDDGLIGRATAYDLRFMSVPLTEGNFYLGTPVPGVPAPKLPGSAESFTVTGLLQGRVYYFALRTVDEAQNWSLVSNMCGYAVPVTSADGPALARWLSPPYPNPGRASVNWSYTLPEAGRVDVEAFEVSGRRVRHIAQAWVEAGAGGVHWDLRDDRGRAVAPGVYLIRAALGGQVSLQRVVVTR
jgi:hypothetical protein